MKYSIHIYNIPLEKFSQKIAMVFWIMQIDPIFQKSIWKVIFIVFLIYFFQICIFFQPLFGLLLQWTFLSRFQDVATCQITSSNFVYKVCTTLSSRLWNGNNGWESKGKHEVCKFLGFIFLHSWVIIKTRNDD